MKGRLKKMSQTINDFSKAKLSIEIVFMLFCTTMDLLKMSVLRYDIWKIQFVQKLVSRENLALQYKPYSTETTSLPSSFELQHFCTEDVCKCLQK